MAWPFAKILRVSLLALAFVLVVASLFLPWWTVKRSTDTETKTATVSPMSVKNGIGGSESELESETEVVAYVLMPLVLLILLLAATAPVADTTFRPWLLIAMGLGALVLAAIAVLYAYNQWPKAAPPEWEVKSFEHEEKHYNEIRDPKKPNEPPDKVFSHKVKATPSLGFYLIIVAAGLAFTESSVHAIRGYFDVGRFDAPESEADATARAPPELRRPIERRP